MDYSTALTGLVEAVLWYFFLWFGLDSIQKKRNSWMAAGVLLLLAYGAFVLCPWVREHPAWQRIWS